MAGEIIGAYIYITYDKRAYVRLIFDTTVYDFIPNISVNNIKTRANDANRNDIYNDNFSLIFPETIVSELEVLNDGKEISFIIPNPMLVTRINFYNSSDSLIKYIILDFVDNFLFRDLKPLVGVAPNGHVRVFLGTNRINMPYDENLRAKIINNQGRVVFILTGYHKENFSFSRSYYGAWTSNTIPVNNGIHMYRRILPAVDYEDLPNTGEKLTFIYKVNSEILHTDIFFNKEEMKLYKPIEDESQYGWLNISTLD